MQTTITNPKPRRKAPQVVLVISTDNAAFDGEHHKATEVARILIETAARIQSHGLEDMPLRDHNGNTVGRLDVWLE